MTIEAQAIEWVRIVAQQLGELCEEVVFLGGATVGLLISDLVMTDVRATKDVDVIVQVGSRGAYAALQERLRAKGFPGTASRREDRHDRARRDASLLSALFAGLNRDANTGFVESFSLGELVLDAELLRAGKP
jgi:hypothetical protein